ncbi:MAG: HTH domain-containing protein [Clostridium sp.]|nr:HTH domain-containing protein [Clostridium sp.]MBQ9072675.1 HTH domain-containing protein [Bacilli bacterium]
MSKFSNLLKMMYLLNEHGRMNRKELSEHLGVSERMIRKYVEDFKEANVEINSFCGAKGGYEINLDNIDIDKEASYKNTIKNLEKENLRLKEQIENINKILNK